MGHRIIPIFDALNQAGQRIKPQGLVFSFARFLPMAIETTVEKKS
jgi:hypothetical protein